ncbi:MAG TPA: DUF962 domain-containing protein [Acidobacteriota bacterium]|jgi:uncharacterized membrane protein YGL010W
MPLKSYIEEYWASHRHPVNNALHFVGIPLIIVSIFLVFWNWKMAAILFVGGWILQLTGHWIEGNRPAFLKNPAFLIVGPISFLQKLFHRSGAARQSRNHE